MASVAHDTNISTMVDSNTTWPPEGISIQTKRIIDECELLEMNSAMAVGAPSGASGLQEIAVRTNNEIL